MGLQLHARNTGFEWSPPSGPYRRVTAGQARDWNEKGYFLLENAFDTDTVKRVISEIGRRVRSELDLDAVLNVAVTEVGMALDLSRAFIRLGDSSEDAPVRAEWDAPGVETIGNAAGRLPVSNLAARERRTVVVGDILIAPELDDPTLGGRDTLVELGTRAVIATPILVFGERAAARGADAESREEIVGGEVNLTTLRHVALLEHEHRT